MRFNRIAWLSLLTVILGSGYIYISSGHDAIASAPSIMNRGSNSSNQIFEDIRARINAQIEKMHTHTRAVTPTLTPKLTPTPTAKPTATPTVKPTTTPTPTSKINQSGYTGAQVFDAVNEYRKNQGLQVMTSQISLCQMASSRLNELLALGKLDDHAGFTNYLNSHSLSSMKLTGIAENLAQGYASAQATVSAWDQSVGHHKLLAGSQYKYGCAAASNKIAVLLGGY